MPLLYIQHTLMLAVVAFNCYGTYAIAHRPPSYCTVDIGGLLNPFNATTAVVCAMWGIILIFMCACDPNQLQCMGAGCSATFTTGPASMSCLPCCCSKIAPLCVQAWNLPRRHSKSLHNFPHVPPKAWPTMVPAADCL